MSKSLDKASTPAKDSQEDQVYSMLKMAASLRSTTRSGSIKSQGSRHQTSVESDSSSATEGPTRRRVLGHRTSPHGAEHHPPQQQLRAKRSESSRLMRSHFNGSTESDASSRISDTSDGHQRTNSSVSKRTSSGSYRHKSSGSRVRRSISRQTSTSSRSSEVSKGKEEMKYNSSLTGANFRDDSPETTVASSDHSTAQNRRTTFSLGTLFKSAKRWKKIKKKSSDPSGT